ncbi:MAG: STAS domain-containing protein [Anaerolineales bacterium]|jgi:anti-sigma B factor antagonist
MDINFLEKHPADIVQVSGSVDALTASVLTDFLSLKISQDHTNLVLDLNQVEFMSSAGLRSVLAALKECRNKGGDLRIAGAQPGVEKVLKMSGFTNILKIFPDSENALASFSN